LLLILLPVTTFDVYVLQMFVFALQNILLKNDAFVVNMAWTGLESERDNFRIKKFRSFRRDGTGTVSSSRAFSSVTVQSYCSCVN
jgi:hypothetical protein